MDAEELINNYSNEHVDHETLELLYELNDLSIVKNLLQIIQKGDDLTVNLHSETTLI